MTLIPENQRTIAAKMGHPRDGKIYGLKDNIFEEILGISISETGSFTDWTVSQAGATLSKSGTIFWYRCDNIITLIGGVNIQTTAGAATGNFKLTIPFTTMPAYTPNGAVMTELFSLAFTDLTDLECALMVPSTFLYSSPNRIEMELVQKNQNLGSYPNWDTGGDPGFLYFKMMWATSVAPIV